MENLGRPERPISTAKEDTLGREGFVRRLTGAVINPDSKMSTGVVVGVTGQWGSGKSSILNLVAERIADEYPDAVVVRFDPWLVSGRNDLVSAFISELLAKIKSSPKAATILKGAVNTLAKYAQQVAPVADFFWAGVGTVGAAALGAVRTRLTPDDSLVALRARLVEQLQKAAIPIVVLIDEVDRVEDAEIRTIAQLVRAVADFPGMSYILAYDPERVAQALGAGAPRRQELERGRAYLEKIVQLQIPLPITMPDEVARLVTGELKSLSHELGLPANFSALGRYVELVQIACGSVVSTPRDVGRLVGTYHALSGMLTGEVDWIDLLAYAVLLTKAPEVVASIRREPGLFIAEVLSRRDAVREVGSSKLSAQQRMDLAVSGARLSPDIRSLIEFLFPKLSDFSSPDDQHLDALSQRRPLITTLRLGLLPGGYKKGDIEALTVDESEAVATKLRAAYDADNLEPLIDRLEEMYPTLVEINHVRLWKGIAQFVKKPDCDWMTSYQPMHSVIRRLAEMLERTVGRDPATFRPIAIKVFTNLRNVDEDVLTAIWLRTHFRAFGLFGWREEGPRRSFLNRNQTVAIAREMSASMRSLHLGGRLLPCRWDLQPVYSMIDMGLWDDACRDLVDRLLAEAQVVDGLTLMLFGASFTTGRDTVASFCTLSKYLDAVRGRLSSPGRNSLHESVVLALDKAISGGIEGLDGEAQTSGVEAPTPGSDALQSVQPAPSEIAPHTRAPRRRSPQRKKQ